MKYLYSLLLFFFYLISYGQKNNYNSIILYEDEYLQKILNSRWYLSSSSEYLFYEKIKSVYTEQLNENGKLSRTPDKTFFDKNKNITKRINYNNNRLDYKVVEFYYLPKYNGDAVYKTVYENINGEIKNILKSEIDTIKHIIINNRFTNNVLNEIDTIFYIKNYKPVEIRTSSVKYSDKSVKKIAYLENGKIYKEVYKSNSSTFGGYIKYNKFGKQQYSYNINFDDFDNIPVDYEDNQKKKELEFIWYNDKDFEFRDKTNTIISFNYKEKKLHKIEKDSDYTTFFNESLLPIKILSVDKKNGLNMETTFEYNKHNELISEKTKNEGSLMIIKTYKYVYDKKNNWTERKEYENGKLIFTTKRQIEYE